jgi:hypothetical protein
MVKAIIELGEREDRILTIIKGKYGLKNKSDAINLALKMFEEQNFGKELKLESPSAAVKNNARNKRSGT